MALTIVDETAFTFVEGVLDYPDFGATLVHTIDDNSGGTKALKLALAVPFQSVTVVDLNGTLYFTAADCAAETNGLPVDASAAPVTLALSGADLWVDPNTTDGSVITSHAQLRPDQAASKTTVLS